MDKIKIIITDDHRLIREGIESIVSTADDIEVVGLAPSGEEAINLARLEKPDVVLMDILMPGMNGLEATRWIKEINNRVGVIMLTMEVTKDYVTAAIKAGVDGYLPKNIGKDILLDALRTVARGEKYFNDAIKKLIFEEFYIVEKLKSPRRSVSSGLSKREEEVLALVAAGKSNAEIADALSISVKTVETHKTHVLMKLGLNNNTELIHYAIRNNIISI